jgi:Cu(I)/Ag(I) efflux system membrane fusion protein
MKARSLVKARRHAVPLGALALAAALAAGCSPAAAGDDHADHDAAVHRASEGVADAAAGDEIAHYTCSMHPSVRNPGPGTCPMCAMALAPVFQRELDSGEIVLDAGRRQQIGVTTARAERRPFAGPVRASGMVTYDQSRLTDVTLRAGGWIDELYADRIGQRVKEGEPLFTLYSPDLFEVQQKYVEALEKLENARKLRSRLSADFLLEMRRQRLRLADLGPDEIERLDERGLPVELVAILAPASGHVIEKNVVAGAAVSPGMRLLRIAGLDRVWVEAEVYESELPSLQVGDRATVTLRYLPGREFHGRIAFVYPWLDSATRTGRVRIELPNPDLALKPEMYAEVVFQRDLGERLAVPQGAVLYAGDRDFVFVDLGDGRLRPQAVTVGGHAGDWVEILDGVDEGDVVVTSGNFLVAAEARLGLALEHWSPRKEEGLQLAAAANGARGGHAGHGHGHGAHRRAPANGAGSGHEGHAPPAAVQAPTIGDHGGHAPAAAVPAPTIGDHGDHGGHTTAAGSPAHPDGDHDGHDGQAPAAESPAPANGGHGGHDGHHGHGKAAEPPGPAPAPGDHAGHDGHTGGADGDHAAHGEGGGHAGHGPGADPS